jgi:choline dehydrogenase
MRKYFQRVERCQYSSKTWDLLTGGEHGFDGWLSTERPKKDTLEDLVKKDPQLQRILAAVALTSLEDLPGSPTEAFIRRAIPKLVSAAFKEDINHMDSVKYRPEGLYLLPIATNGGKRASVRDRIRTVQQVCPNQLIVKTNVLATKVLLEKEAPANGEHFRAVGVECREGEHLYRADPKAVDALPSAKTFRAKRDIIISGGAFNTPQLLMLSGIGPMEELQRHSIPVNIDLQGVGRNLQDRYEVGIVYKLKENLSTLANAKFEDNEQSDPVYKEWKEATPEERRDGKGFLYSSNGVIIATMKRSSFAKNANESPEAMSKDTRRTFRSRTTSPGSS